MKAEIFIGDVSKRLAEIPDGSVQCCVTSPPYWGLRDYGTATWDGGDNDCDHQGKPMATKANINRNCGTGNDVKNATAREFFKDVCGKCGATRVDSQLGLEATPQEYVANMVAVFREVWRVLADDGVLWLNLGDSYAAARGGSHQPAETLAGGVSGKTIEGDLTNRGRGSNYQPSRDATRIGLKHKDLVGIPWRVAFALQDDGWYLRQDIIWAKKNAMPESVRDRCTKSHEYIFMLTKQPRYYYDNKAILEPVAEVSLKRSEYAFNTDRESSKTAGGIHVDKMGSRFVNPAGRNKRDVWFEATARFKGAHFAVMPEGIVEPCILASTRPGDTVLDPFTGSGTVAVVALKHGRNYVGTELNEEYANIAINRLTKQFGELLHELLLSFPQTEETTGGTWNYHHTKSPNDFGQK